MVITAILAGLVFAFFLISFGYFCRAAFDSKFDFPSDKIFFGVIGILSLCIFVISGMAFVTLFNVAAQSYGYPGEVYSLDSGGIYLVLGQYQTPNGKVLLLRDKENPNEVSRFVRVEGDVPLWAGIVVVHEYGLGDKKLIPAPLSNELSGVYRGRAKTK